MSTACNCKNCGHALTRPDIQIPQSPAREFFRNNSDIPSSVKIQIGDVISTVQSLELELDKEIQDIQSVLEELLRKRTDLHDQGEKHRELLHPIRRLPAELLAEVFGHSMTASWLHDIASSNNPGQVHRRITEGGLNKSPLIFSSVCALWRSIAVSTPSLWSSVSLQIERSRQTMDLLLMKMWLARAREMPLFISLTCNFLCEGDGMAPLFTLFASYSQQWQAVSLHLPPSLMDHLTSVKNHLPKLRWLSVGYAWGATYHPMDMFQAAPRLRSIELAEGISPGEILLPWAQLHNCDFGFAVQPPELLDLLQRMADIEACQWYIKDNFDPRDDSSNGPIITLPRLHSLIIVNESPSQSFLKRLNTPALQKFSFIPDDPDSDTMPVIMHLITQGKLRSLTLSSPFSRLLVQDIITPHMMLAILKANPDLRELRMLRNASSSMTSVLWDVFASLVPRLHFILVECSPGRIPPEFNISHFLNAISPRVGAGLQRVIICAHGRARRSEILQNVPELPARFSQLRSAGLEFSMTLRGMDFFDNSLWDDYD
ncbi:hypothetical protein FIBSPDRAFT_441954 [Athelia psychrophila]|uniref:Uncharacterized protein n=1 Tax=Athelia psychrophila TaxID=1759441 RepID=A0A166MHA1_9AGAM|nr:hypothetical protein FIBSPDRAFT_441954 [Fibularhizoctonia sp. CBS 109695]